MIKPWQVWCYSGSLVVAAVLYYGFTLSVVLYLAVGKHIPIISQKPAAAIPEEFGVPLFLAMWTRTNAILMLAVLILRTAAFPLNSGSPVLRLKSGIPALNQALWLIALVAAIPCLLIYVLVDAPIAELLSPQGTLAAASTVKLTWLAVLSITLLLYDAAYIANTRERVFIDQLGWKHIWQQIAAFAGRLAFYLIHPLLGILFILTWLYDWSAQRRRSGEAAA